jgi:hypothetical protein
MKKILYVSIIAALVFTACKKNLVPVNPPDLLNVVPPNYLSVVQKYVRQHPAMADYNSIDFNNYRLSKQKAHWYLRLPLKNKSFFTDFIVLQTDSLGNTSDGRIVHLEQNRSGQTASNKATEVRSNFNGSIGISPLDAKMMIHSAITNGYIEAFHPRLFKSLVAREQSFPVPYDDLPEVIVVAYLPVVTEGGGFSFADFMMLQALFDGGGASPQPALTEGQGNGGTYSYAGDYYSNGDGYPNGYNNSGQPTPYQSAVDLPDIAVAPDYSYTHPAIDMNAWMKCFTDIPDAGASCSVTLFGDLPVDTDPSIGLNIWSGNTGHCFLQLTKTNAQQSVTQIIGFTAESPSQAIVNADAFVPGKTVDNAGHKYDCSIIMNLTTYGLNTIIDKMKSLSATMPYSVVNYDCLDYGLEVFNSVRPGNPLRIPKVYSASDPFSNIATGPKLYTLLENMVASGSPEAPYITLGGPRNAGVSHGSCQ